MLSLNLISVYFRSGIYPLELLSAVGAETTGKVVAFGDVIIDFKINDKVICGGAMNKDRNQNDTASMCGLTENSLGSGANAHVGIQGWSTIPKYLF